MSTIDIFQSGLPIPLLTFCSKLIESVKMMAVWLGHKCLKLHNASGLPMGDPLVMDALSASQFPQPVFAFCSKLIESVRMMAVWLGNKCLKFLNTSGLPRGDPLVMAALPASLFPQPFNLASRTGCSQWEIELITWKCVLTSKRFKYSREC